VSIHIELLEALVLNLHLSSACLLQYFKYMQTALAWTTMEDVDFTDDEIAKELADLGYAVIPAAQFNQFKKGLCMFWWTWIWHG